MLQFLERVVPEVGRKLHQANVPSLLHGRGSDLEHILSLFGWAPDLSERLPGRSALKVVGLVGMSGIGKSYVARELSRIVEGSGRFTTGVCFTEV